MNFTFRRKAIYRLYAFRKNPAAAIGIYDSIARIIKAFTASVQITGYNLCNLFYSDRDYEGARFSFRSAVMGEAGIALKNTEDPPT